MRSWVLVWVRPHAANEDGWQLLKRANLTMESSKFVLVAKCFSLLRRLRLRSASFFEVRFLCYHSVIHDFDSDPSPSVWVTASGFRAQLDRLHENGMRIVGMNEALNVLDRKPIVPGRYVCLTFDDGLRDNATIAWPILRERGLSAHFFISPGLVGKTSSRVVGGRTRTVHYMDRAMITQLASEGATFGSHALTHSDLTQVPDEELERQLCQSKALLESWIGPDSGATLAYPYGRWGRREQAAAKRAGYSIVFISRFGTIKKPLTEKRRFEVPRTPIGTNEDDQLFNLKINAGFDWIAEYSALKASFYRSRALTANPAAPSLPPMIILNMTLSSAFPLV